MSMQKGIASFITGDCVQYLRTTIQESDGNEVFFLGVTDENKVVVEVRVFARGNECEVPALLQVASPGDVMIHNHPSGGLRPSSQDVEISAVLGNQGVGSYIVDNDVESLYIIVEAFEKFEFALLDRDTMGALLAPGGCLFRIMPQYEYRPPQVDMVYAVTEAFNDKKIALIEAGTGTGKTMAYLIPALFWAVQNHERCVVSTNTINLQEQLIHKDIPLLKDALDIEFKAVLVKGRGNYLCKRKAESLGKDFQLLLDGDEQETVRVLLDWARTTKDGSRSDLNFIPPPEVWELINSESDTCIRVKCPFYRDCFVNRARREANSADILVVNHHLLCADLALRSETDSYSDMAVLPPYKRIIIDEAHNLEDVATSYFGRRVTRNGLQRLLGRLQYLKKKDKGILPLLRQKIEDASTTMPRLTYVELTETIDNSLLVTRAKLSALISEVFNSVYDFISINAEGDNEGSTYRIRPCITERDDWKEMVVEPLDALISQLLSLAEDITELIDTLSALKKEIAAVFESPVIELRAIASRIGNVVLSLKDILSSETNDNFVRWIEVKRGKRQIRTNLHASPLEVSCLLYQGIYARFRTVIMTSATLTSGNTFDYMKQRLGLNFVSGGRCAEKVLPSPFDYKRQVIVGVPTDIPEPPEEHYREEINKFIYKILSISEGRAFVLFTSYSMLNYCYTKLQEPLRLLDLRILRQGDDNRHSLLQRFKRSSGVVLFATASFWEGVDVEGRALECLILVKLPFSVPTNPVIEARVELIQRNGGNPFLDYVVPRAVVKFKQGFGRLIRSRNDRGAIIILDKRIIEKTYGKTFLESLPECNSRYDTTTEIVKALKNFYAVSEALPREV